VLARIDARLAVKQCHGFAGVIEHVPRRMKSLCRDIVRLRVPQYLVSEVRAQEAFGVEVYRSTKQSGKAPAVPLRAE